ncbi:uncharacterized protein CIMG_13085 [Coccidioides immitis RS]|uniref:Uncharacterized protein n=1 Tax=Coccidioides immitis (strain RS) TaxID=246410 RepID=A0A0D8JU42_COCIM|nr:uncharacterized protein CIMG_13085 [Coccidioides immitis RS]KJF60629.1 hypothetical protein CIMG_13085 [Coccidioides immitis RS]
MSRSTCTKYPLARCALALQFWEKGRWLLEDGNRRLHPACPRRGGSLEGGLGEVVPWSEERKPERQHVSRLRRADRKKTPRRPIKARTSWHRGKEQRLISHSPTFFESEGPPIGLERVELRCAKHLVLTLYWDRQGGIWNCHQITVVLSRSGTPWSAHRLNPFFSCISFAFISAQNERTMPGLSLWLDWTTFEAQNRATVS